MKPGDRVIVKECPTHNGQEGVLEEVLDDIYRVSLPVTYNGSVLPSMRNTCYTKVVAAVTPEDEYPQHDVEGSCTFVGFQFDWYPNDIADALQHASEYIRVHGCNGLAFANVYGSTELRVLIDTERRDI